MRKKQKEKKLVEADAFRIAPDGDVIYHLIGWLPVPVIWGGMLALNVVIYVAVGLLVNNYYPAASADFQNIQRINEPAEIMNGINIWVIFVPALWAYYRWFPEGIFKNLYNVEQRGVISPVEGEPLSSRIHRRMGSKWIYAIASLATIVSLSYWFFILVPGQQSALNGMINFWYYKWWTILFFLFIYAPANYIFFIYILRALISVFAINSYFRSPNAIRKLYPMYPDQCGGMGEVGALAANTILIIVLVPTWATIYSFYTTLAGGQSLFFLLAIVYVVYLILAPIILTMFLWQPHKAMLQFKYKQLNEISVELLRIKNSISGKIKYKTQGQEIKKELEKYKQLQEHYENLQKHIPVWPISLPAMRWFGTIIGSPVVLGVLSNVFLDYVKRHYLGI